LGGRSAATRIAPTKLGFVRHGAKSRTVSYASVTSGSVTRFVGDVVYGWVPASCPMTELVGSRLPEPSNSPRSHSSIGVASPGWPIPMTSARTRVPARLSHRMLLNSNGLLNSGEPAGRVACSSALLDPLEMPAGAGSPLLVTAVAVVTFFMIVLLSMRTLGASSRAMPPPSCVDTLFTIMLL
jgi:hypothetical protein